MTAATYGRFEAERRRHAALVGLQANRLKIPDLIDQAKADPALRKLSLSAVLLAQGLPPAAVKRHVSTLRSRFGGDPKLTIGWLLDGRASAVERQHFLAVLIAPRATRQSPYVGFPQAQSLTQR
jgi:hypothetical protein